MAGFFGFFDYNKPGPGVPENAPPKAPFIVFFEILQRKFWNFIKVNMMFLVFNLPALIIGLLGMVTLVPNIFPDAYSSSEALTSELMLKFIILTMMMCVPMITVGPAQAGFTYIMRNYAREEHAFLWSDFKDTAVKNFKQSLIVSTINTLVTFLMLFTINAYNSLVKAGQLPELPGTMLMAFMVILFVLFAMMNMYIYPIMITFSLSIKQIYKNALIFAVIKFIPNVGILLLSAFIIALTFGLIIPFSQVIGIFLYILLTISFIGFLTNFYVYPKLKKYMISRLEDEEEDDEEDDEDDDDGEDGDEEDDGEEDGDEVGKDNGDDKDNGSEDAEDDGNGDETGSNPQDGENGVNQDESDDEIKRYF